MWEWKPNTKTELRHCEIDNARLLRAHILPHLEEITSLTTFYQCFAKEWNPMTLRPLHAEFDLLLFKATTGAKRAASACKLLYCQFLENGKVSRVNFPGWKMRRTLMRWITINFLLLFPRGEDGWKLEMRQISWKKTSIRQIYSYQLHERV